MKAAELMPNPANWRTHPPAQSEALAAILRDVGQVGEVYAYHSERNGGALVLVDGHLRCEDYPDAEWDVAICDLTDAEADKILLSRDPLAAMAEVSKAHLEELFGRVSTDEGGLRHLMEDLATANKLAWASYGAEAGQPGVDLDDVPAPPDKATTRRGDLWVLGDHRLLCGDSSAAGDVDRLLGGVPVHLVNTDPPYNVAVESRSNNSMAAGLCSFPGGNSDPKRDVVRRPEKAKPTGKKMRAKDRQLANDFHTEEAYQGLLAAWFGTIARVLVPGHSFYCWGGYLNCATYPGALAAAGLKFSQAVIWVKEHPVMNRKDFMGNHEWCFYGWREGGAHRWFGQKNVPDVWRFARPSKAGVLNIGSGLRLKRGSDQAAIEVMPPNLARTVREVVIGDEVLVAGDADVDVWAVKKVTPQNMIHLTEKPVELALRAVRYSSLVGENVLDLFGGSGSTLMACEVAKRRAFVMELDELYCDVIVQRWERFTGRKAVCGG